MLGVLHKVVLGLAPPQLAAFFPLLGNVAEPSGRQRLRGWAPLHSKQLGTHCGIRSSNIMKRSLFGLVWCYNQLPQCVVDASTVKKLPTRIARSFEGVCVLWQSSRYLAKSVHRWLARNVQTGLPHVFLYEFNANSSCNLAQFNLN